MLRGTLARQRSTPTPSSIQPDGWALRGLLREPGKFRAAVVMGRRLRPLRGHVAELDIVDVLTCGSGQAIPMCLTVDVDDRSTVPP